MDGGIKFKDVAHLYIGCRIHASDMPGDERTVLHDIYIDGLSGQKVLNTKTFTHPHDEDGICVQFDQRNDKPLLRRWSDINREDLHAASSEFADLSEQEKDHAVRFFRGRDKGTVEGEYWIDFIYGMVVLAQRGIDIFGLIDAGEALDINSEVNG